MKQFLSILFLLSVLFSGAQTPGEKLSPIAQLRSGQAQFTVDKFILIAQVNDGLYGGASAIDNVAIENGITVGDKQEAFYYIIYTSSTSDARVVRWLHKKDGVLYIKDTEEIGMEDYYISCKGIDSCYPRMFVIAGDYRWCCTETPVCPSPEEAKKNPCVQTTSLIIADE